MTKIFDILRPEEGGDQKEGKDEEREEKRPFVVKKVAEEKEEDLWRDEDVDEEERDEEKSPKKSIVNCFLSIVFLALLLVFLYLLFPDIVKVNWKGGSIKNLIKKTAVTLPEGTKVEENTSTTIAPNGTTTTTNPSTSSGQTLTKETVKIKAVNARGMKQAATTIKGILEQNGYKNIETGDLDEGYKQTYVFYGNDNAKDLADSIGKILSNGRNVKVEKSDKATGVDILVIGGLS